MKGPLNGIADFGGPRYWVGDSEGSIIWTSGFPGMILSFRPWDNVFLNNNIRGSVASNIFPNIYCNFETGFTCNITSTKTNIFSFLPI